MTAELTMQHVIEKTEQQVGQGRLFQVVVDGQVEWERHCQYDEYDLMYMLFRAARVEQEQMAEMYRQSAMNHEIQLY